MIAIVPPHGICFVTGKPLASHRTFTIRYANVQNKQTRCSRAVERKSSYWVNVPGTTLQLTTMLPTKQRPRGVAMFIVKIDLKLYIVDMDSLQDLEPAELLLEIPSND